MIKVDVHTHTSHSHGKNSVEEMYRQGKLLGFEVMGFSEHSPRPLAYTYPREYREHLSATFGGYIASVQDLKKRAGGPQILLGLEMDYFPLEEAFIAETLARHPYDYVIGGLHFLGTWGFDHSQTDWDALSEEQKRGHYVHYYETLQKMAASRLMNIAAHPDLIKIFSVDSFKEWLQEKSAQQLVRQALLAIKENDMSMEISSAGLRKPCKEIYPGPVLMQLAAELGLPITFGSDAHCVNTLGYAFEQLAAYAKDYGYTHSVYFANGQWQKRGF